MFEVHEFDWLVEAGTPREREVTVKIVATDERSRRLRMLIFEGGDWRPRHNVDLDAFLAKIVNPGA